MADIRDVVRRLDPAVAVVGLATYEERLAGSVAEERFRAALVTSLGLLAVVIALLGIYGTLSNLVTRMVRELGIRLALGEGRGAIVARVLKRAGMLAAAGITCGLLVSAASAGYFSNVLFGVDARDAGTYAMVALLVWSVCLLAALGPAVRASRLDPVSVIRSD